MSQEERNKNPRIRLVNKNGRPASHRYLSYVTSCFSIVSCANNLNSNEGEKALGCALLAYAGSFDGNSFQVMTARVNARPALIEHACS